ncbi:MAG: glycosyltransferase [Kiritimatiellae bacterium]|nr:glycosyltransferase [Kiritimatiellia bacterium]MDW8459522.1 glycosyltransferase [Verrucomicrobiota bacterium]
MVKFPDAWAGLNVALAHDWLTGMRGGEKCLEWLCAGFPRAPIYTLLHKPGSVSRTIESHEIRTSVLHRIPGIASHYRWWLPLFPWAVERFPPIDAALLISTSHCAAKALRVKPPGKHLCYCFTPMRYAWTFHDEYLGARSAKRALASPILARLRDWDRRVCDRVDRFIGISRHVCERIRRFYGREADLVYPPVDIDFYTPGKPEERRGEFDLIVSALVPYKRIDLAVRAYTRSGFPLKVVGVGTESRRLRSMAGPRIQFLGWQSNETIRDLYRSCRLLVFPGEEDFGIVPLEAQACSAPVVAFARGGALESLVPGETAVFFDEQTEDALLAAVEAAAGRHWDAARIRRNAERFGPQAFIDGIARNIAELVGEPCPNGRCATQAFARNSTAC